MEFRNAKTKTQASIKNVNSGAGTYTVTVDQAPQGRQIKNIRVAAWSQAHQENLFWYSTAPSGMHTEVQVSQPITSTNQAIIRLTSMWTMSMVALKALTSVKQPFILVRQYLKLLLILV